MDNGYTEILIHKIFESGKTPDPKDEISEIITEIAPSIPQDILNKVHTDVSAFFSNSSTQKQKDSHKYHNLRHTYSVALATARLFHGLHQEQREFSGQLILQGMIAAYFHDLGMLHQQTNILSEQLSSIYHEDHSVALLASYLDEHDYHSLSLENCSKMIHCTRLDWSQEKEPIKDKNLLVCGQIVATADILAQMADRYYLESLPLLFEEQEKSGRQEHDSALALLQDTTDFHVNIIKRRLKITLGDLAPAMQTHFKSRWQIDRNLYLEKISLNLKYLQNIKLICEHNYDCWKRHLRRTPP